MTTRLCVALVIALSAAQIGSAAVTEIPPFSDALARERGPTEAPFVATYRSHGKVLAFVGADHVFTDENSTIDMIDRTFVKTQPSGVILEGFPTAMGPNPEVIQEAVRRRRNPDADGFARGEASFAASRALARHVPFVGGEPTIDEEIEGLVRLGYEHADVLFAMRLRAIGQARRSGEMPVGDTAAFAKCVGEQSRAVADMTGTAPATVPQFVADYLRLVGVDPVSDPEMPHRYDPGSETMLRRMGSDNMRVRDQHLLATIMQQLDLHPRVLVVYGSSHWTTLSRALETRLGKPVILARRKVSGS
jgi:hypothetical protein